MTEDTHRAIEAVWRIESARLIAGLARIVRDVGLAEDLAQDALIAALERWPESGVPENPGAWLMATAKNRAIDRLRRDKRLEDKREELGREIGFRQGAAEANLEAAIDDPVGDDLLRLVFISCHPILSTEARVALTLRLLGGLETFEIARAFLVPEATIAQRIVRAKRTLAAAGVPFEVPRGPELAARLSSVLEVVYLIFNEGYAATAGDDWMRPALCEDALRLGRILAELVPKEPEVHGLVALMEIQASRSQTDWARIARLCDALARLAPSPVVDLNRAVALAMAFGPAAGLELADTLISEPSLRNYHLLPAVRGDLLARLGRLTEAREEFERAASLTRNGPERKLLLERAAACARESPPRQPL